MSRRAASISRASGPIDNPFSMNLAPAMDSGAFIERSLKKLDRREHGIVVDLVKQP